jgi:hypothetical protein
MEKIDIALNNVDESFNNLMEDFTKLLSEFRFTGFSIGEPSPKIAIIKDKIYLCFSMYHIDIHYAVELQKMKGYITKKDFMYYYNQP